MAKRITDVYVEIGETRTALWCDVCLLPSRFEMDIHLLYDKGAQMATFSRCRGCGAA